MKVLKNFSKKAEGEYKEEEQDGAFEKITQLLLFLWFTENLRVSKVSLNEHPNNDNFYSLAQKMMRKLDKEETSTEENSK